MRFSPLPAVEATPVCLQERFYFGDTVLPLFESGIPLLKERLSEIVDVKDVTIAYPDEGAWKRFHAQLGEYPEASGGPTSMRPSSVDGAEQSALSERTCTVGAGDLHEGARRRQAHRAAEGGRGPRPPRRHRRRPRAVGQHAARVREAAQSPGAAHSPHPGNNMDVAPSPFLPSRPATETTDAAGICFSCTCCTAISRML